MNPALRAGAYAALAVGFVAPGLFAGALPAFRDLLVLVVPMRLGAARAVAAGDLPLWTPDLFLGAPLLASWQAAVLYPPSLLVYLLPEAQGLAAFLGFHLALGGWGMDAFLRARERVAPAAALFGGLTYAAGGFVASLLPLTNHLEAAAWLPWILLRAERYAEAPTRQAFVALAALIAMQLLTGAPETVLLTAALVAVVLPRAAVPGAAARALLGVLAAALLAVAATALQLVPTLEYLAETDRAEVLPFASVAAESLGARSLQQLALPHRFSDGAPGLTPEGGVPLLWSLHIGAAPLVLLLARPPGFVWVAAITVGLGFALGTQLPFLAFAYGVAPDVIGVFRFPAKFFLLCHVGLVVLAARGADRAVADPAAARRCAFAAFSIVAGMAAISLALSASPAVWLAGLGYQLRAGVDGAVLAHVAASASLGAIRVAAVALVTAVTLLFAIRRRGTEALLGTFLAVVTAADLVLLHQPIAGWVGRSTLPSDRPQTIGLRAGDRAFHFCTSGFGCKPEFAPGVGTWRGTLRTGVPIDQQAGELWAAFVPNTGTLRGLGAVGGTDGLVTRSQRDLWNALAALPPPLGARLLHAYGVAALVGAESLPGLSVSYADDELPLVVHPTGPRS